MKLFIIIFISLLPLSLSAEYFKNYLQDAYLKAYPTLKITNISIQTPRKKNLQNAKIQEVSLRKYALSKNKGTLAVTYEMANGRERRSYLKYIITADIVVLSAKDDIRRNTPITAQNTQLSLIKFKKFSHPPLISLNTAYMAKTNIKKNRIILSSHIKKKMLLQKGTQLYATLQEDGCEVQLKVTTINEGDIGDIIRVKNSKSKIMKAKIISRERILIQ